MVAPRSRNPLFNRTPNYQRVNTVDTWYGTKPLPAGMLGQPGAAQNPLRRPADSGVPGAGYDQAAEAAAVLQRMAENPVSAAMAPVQPASPKQLISPGNPMAPPVTQGPDLNMNFTGGMGAGMATRIAGLAPGLAGMVSQGMLAGVGNGLAASKRSPLSFLPPSGMQQALPGEANSANRLNAIENTPRVTSSMQAGMAPMDIPALSNGYSPLPSITEGQRYAQGLPMDRAGQSNRIANQNPMFAGMQSRFGEGGALSPTGAYAQSGGTGWYDRLSTQEKYGYGPTTPGVDGRISSDPRYATGMLPKDLDRPPRGTPEDKAYLHQKYLEQERRQQDYRDQHGGMSSRQVRRQEQKDRSEAFRFGKAVQNGLNPMSKKAEAMFPGAAAKFKNGDNPMAANSPFKPDAPNTPENIIARHDARKANYEGSLTLQNWGVDPEASAPASAISLYSGLTSGKLEDVSDDGLLQLFNHLKTYGKNDKGEAPFTGAMGGDLLNELWGLPESTKAPDVRKWAERYRAEMEARKREAESRVPFPGM